MRRCSECGRRYYDDNERNRDNSQEISFLTMLVFCIIVFGGLFIGSVYWINVIGQ